MYYKWMKDESERPLGLTGSSSAWQERPSWGALDLEGIQESPWNQLKPLTWRVPGELEPFLPLTPKSAGLSSSLCLAQGSKIQLSRKMEKPISSDLLHRYSMGDRIATSMNQNGGLRAIEDKPVMTLVFIVQNMECDPKLILHLEES